MAEVMTRAKALSTKYPQVFKAMYEHSDAAGHADDSGVIFQKILTNANLGKEEYWMPEDCDKEAIYKDAIEIADQYSR